MQRRTEDVQGLKLDRPSLTDISPCGGEQLDERAAVGHFLNKSVGEASELFFENASYYLEDFMWMGAVAFSYYLPAVMPYLQSEESRGDAESASALISYLQQRLADDADSVRATRAAVLRVLEYIQANDSKFGADEEIFGNLGRAAQRLAGRVKAI